MYSDRDDLGKDRLHQKLHSNRRRFGFGVWGLDLGLGDVHPSEAEEDNLLPPL